jgi:hypothetical protein
MPLLKSPRGDLPLRATILWLKIELSYRSSDGRYIDDSCVTSPEVRPSNYRDLVGAREGAQLIIDSFRERNELLRNLLGWPIWHGLEKLSLEEFW